MRKTKNAAGFSSPAASKSTQKNSYQDYTINPDESKEGIHRNPIRLHRQPDTLPATLKQMNQWCLSGLNKEPLDTAGYRIDVTKSANFSSFQDVVAASATVTCAGVGFILTSTDNVVVVDVDHCVNPDGSYTELGLELLGMLPTYAELSQSRTGLHLIFSDADIPGNFTGRKGVVEIYSSHRYFALTGWKLAFF